MKMLVTHIPVPKAFLLMAFTALGCGNLNKHYQKNGMEASSFVAAKQKFMENAKKLAAYTKSGLKKEENNHNFSRNTLTLELALRHKGYNALYMDSPIKEYNNNYAENLIINYPIIARRVAGLKNNKLAKNVSGIIRDYEKGYRGPYFSDNVKNALDSSVLGAISNDAPREVFQSSEGPTFDDVMSAKPALVLILLYVGADQSWVNLKLVGNKDLNKVMDSLSNEYKITESLRNMLDYNTLFEILRGYKREGDTEGFLEFIGNKEFTRVIFNIHPRLFKMYIEGEKWTAFPMRKLQYEIFEGIDNDMYELMERANFLDKGGKEKCGL